MPKSQKPKEGEIYPVSTVLLEQFLTSKGCMGIEIDGIYAYWENKEKFRFRLPHQHKFSKEEVETIILGSELTIAQFEDFIDSINDWDFFDSLIDMSLKTPSLKHKKGGNDPVK